MSTPGVLMMLAASGATSLKTFTYYASTTVTIPLGVTALVNLYGQGAAGTPYVAPVAPTFGQTTVRVVGLDYFPGNSSGAFEGNYTWGSLTSIAIGARDAFNSGADSTGGYNITQYYATGDYRYDFSGYTASPGVDVNRALSISYSPNWQFSGDISGGSYISAYADVVLEYYTSYGNAEYPATTGGSSTGFGKTFPGGVGGAAGITNFGPQSVSSGNYNLVIPSGGWVTFSYYG